MKEEVINIYDILLSDGYETISFIKKDNIYIIEKCYVKNDIILLLYSNKFDSYNLANIEFQKMKGLYN